MITLIAAAAVAAASPAVGHPGTDHASMMQRAPTSHPGDMAGMKDCCCKDMMDAHAHQPSAAEHHQAQ